MQYLSVWQGNRLYAEACEEKEYNVKDNVSWKKVSKDDPRKMWKIIDYKEKESMSQTQNNTISPQAIHQYFTNIFQAKHLASKPTVDDIQDDIHSYT